LTTDAARLARTLLERPDRKRPFIASLCGEDELDAVAHELRSLGCLVLPDRTRCSLKVWMHDAFLS